MELTLYAALALDFTVTVVTPRRLDGPKWRGFALGPRSGAGSL